MYPKVTHNNQINAASGDIDIESGQPIIVYGYSISEEVATRSTVDFKTSIDRTANGGSAAGTVFHSITVTDGTIENQVAFMADSGLTLDVTTGLLNVTIFHSQQGS